MNTSENLGKYLTLEAFCTCTQTYAKYRDRIDPYPQNPESLRAISALIHHLLDPIIDEFGWDNFRLTYGFCSKDLKRFLEKKDPVTGEKNGRVAPNLDRHMAHETNKNGNYYCPRLGAACDFAIAGHSSAEVIEWILTQQLPFESIYFYGRDRPLHISYGPQHKRDIWTFSAQNLPTKKGIEPWLALAKKIP
ncbi:hypothetical protein [Phormidium sp. CCY1219]|uniref:hypothetical protein n=1 Tax=Phormidium sp. CCY1219 TaxID=2886104 RepID=UPI002D1E57BA|nr:hypothetical protein [Phormidium sp. CCY1219]MEB3826802.1 hypothetical protein [Phormidium sp. CCY1219]